MSKINFFSADKSYALKEKNKIKKWIISEAAIYQKEIEEINIIFCSDEYLLEINKKFLNHFDLTDVITFDNSVENSPIVGEIYLSVDRIQENAKIFNVEIREEFLRIIIHGSLHLFGFTDNTKQQRDEMREKENQALLRFQDS